MGIFDKIFGKKEQKETLDQGLEKTKAGFFDKITKAMDRRIACFILIL